MQGKQAYQPRLFSTVNLDALVPAGHLLRKIDRVIDFGFVRELTKDLYSENNGRPSIDPELFFRITLLSYLYNIDSDRQVCEEVQYNMAYRWFCRLAIEDSVPDHSSLTRIRDRLGEETFRKIFECLIEACMEKGIVKATCIMMDGSLIKADAALKSMAKKGEDGKPVAKDDDDEPPKSIAGKKFSNETHVSRTDPDAALAGKANETKQLRYKIHASIDRETGLVIDPFITHGAAVEGNLALERLTHIENTFDVEVEELTADRGYGYGVNLEALESMEVRSYVPNFHSKVGEKIDRKLFHYDEASDLFICKAGHELTRKTNYEQEAENFAQKYQIESGHCFTCPHHSKCFKVAPKKTQRKALSLNVFWRLQEKTKKREQRARFRAAMKERQWKMEGTFAAAKTCHGLDRARYRGRAKMQIQAYMTSFVLNLKRIAAMGLGPCGSIQFIATWLAEFFKQIFCQQFPLET